MLRRLLQVGLDRQLGIICADILTDHHAMQRVCEKLGFPIEYTAAPIVVKAQINLKELASMA